MRKLIGIITALMLIMSVLVLTGCGGNNDSSEKADASEEVQAEQDTASDAGNSDTLVIYFSETGNTRGVAEKIASITDADIYEIKAAEEYTDADLDWNDSDSRATREQNDASARPEIGSDPVSLEGYKTVYIGYPIWWGEEPRIMDTFVESHDFDGITMIPFCTSGSSDIGKSAKNLADNAGSGNWLEGERFDGGVSEEELKSWIEGLK